MCKNVTLRRWQHHCCRWKGLTLILLTWRIGWVPNNASKWQTGFNSVFKVLSIAYSECVSLALLIQLAKPMRRVVLWFVALPVAPYFSTLSHKQCDFRGEKKALLKIKRVFWFSRQHLCEKFLILSSSERGMIKNVYWYPLFLSEFSDTWIFDRFSKNTQISNFMKIRPVRAELFHADGWTDGQTERKAGKQTEWPDKGNSRCGS